MAKKKDKQPDISVSDDEELIDIEQFLKDEPLMDDEPIDFAAADDEDDDAPSASAELQAENNELKDKLMRALAEAENQRKRGERDRRDAEIYGGRKLARDMLSVYDNMKRALDSLDDEKREANKNLVEGIELTQRELLNIFAQHNITPINPEVGEKFDPEIHQAMFEAPMPDVKAGCVLQVMSEGFMIADRLLRPAQVGVSSGG